MLVTALVLILGAIPNPSTELVVAPLHRIVNIFIACMLACSVYYLRDHKAKGKTHDEKRMMNITLQTL